LRLEAPSLPPLLLTPLRSRPREEKEGRVGRGGREGMPMPPPQLKTRSAAYDNQVWHYLIATIYTRNPIIAQI